VDAVVVIDSTGVPAGMITGSDLIGLMATTVTGQLAAGTEETEPTVEP
jgi:hypothetical protein